MKKFISLLFCVAALAFALVIGCGAVSINDGMEAMVAEFQDGESALDYVYYSPIKSSDDEAKYPLVIWLHGNNSGNYKRHQVRNSCIYNWASEEYQERFEETNGAYLLLPRCPTNTAVIAWGIERKSALKKTIDEFIAENQEHIDMSRIYIGGYSMGGKMTVIMASSYPDFFAAAFPMSPVYEPTTTELKALANMPVWLFVNKNDKYISLDYKTAVLPRWNYLMKQSNCRELCRFTTFTQYYSPEGVANSSVVHNTWDAVIYDMFMQSGEVYYASSTVDGNGNEVNLIYPNGVISWLSSQSLEKRTGETKSFWQKIIDLLNTISSWFSQLI